jgi:hypothetical protein
VNAQLLLLALRRTLTPAFVLTACIVLALATQLEWAAPSEWSGTASLRAGAFARQGVWTIGALTLLPVLVHKAASTIPRWRTGEVDWLAKSPANRSGILLATWCGAALAAAVVVLMIAFAAELAARDTQAALRLVSRLPAPDGALIDDGARLAWSVDAPAARAGDRLHIGVVMIANVPAADVVVGVSRRASDGQVQRSETRAHVVAACELDVAVPAGDGALEIELKRAAPGAIVALDGNGVAWLTPIESASAISCDIAAHAWLATIAWLALALGCGAWVSPLLALMTLAAIALASWIGASTAFDAWWPWGAMPDALDLCSRAVAPGMPAFPRFGGALACVALGLALARVDVATWRRNA